MSHYIYEVEGSSPKSNLISAIRLIEAKNPMLRTAVVQNGPKYLQVFPAGNESSFIETDSFDNYLSQTASKPLEFGSPAFQYCLVKEKDRYLFIFSAFHAFFDGFSRLLFEQELLQALKDPFLYSLEPTRPWFGDLAIHLESQALESSRSWKRYLEHAPAENVHQGVSVYGSANGTLRKSLRMSKMKSTNITSSTIVAAAWTLALANHSGFHDILFGLVKSGRSYPYDGIERMFGLLTAITLFRLQVCEATESIDSLLQRVQHEILASSAGFERDPPVDDPRVQSLLNIKFGLPPMQPTTIDSLEKNGLNKILPRRDLENWNYGKNLTTVNLEATVEGNQISFTFQYMSALEDGRARKLFDNFWELFNKLWRSDVESIGDLLNVG
jgi:Condensation domain